MANRYWRGGTGTWDASNTANWSATSGGAGGASAPTLADDVFFDAGSDAGGIFTVTIGTGAVCRDITIAGLDQVMTLAGSAAWSIYGSLAFPATNLTRTYSANISFLSTTTGKTIITNGVVLTSGACQFLGAGGEWTLGGALTVGILRLFNGNLDVSASNYSITVYTTLEKTNGTVNARLGSIVFVNPSNNFLGGGATYYNVSFTNTTSGTVTITGANTFNNLTFTSPAATGIRGISLAANQTVNGTLTLGTANTAIRRMFMFSDVVGTPRTITANAIAALADVDFRDIVAAGASGTWSGTRLGNCLGNSNITFDASKSVYRIGTGNWSATQWALSSGGAVNVNNFPLAQDDAIFDANTAVGTQTMDFGWQIGGMDFSALTAAVTMVHGAQNIYKNIVLGSFVTLSGGSFGYIFVGQGTTQQLTSAGKSGIVTVVVNNATGTLQLQDALTTSGVFTLTSGTLDFNDNDLNCTTFSSTGARTRHLDTGATGELHIAGATFTASGSNLTTSGTGLISMDSASSKTFAGGGFSYPTINQGGLGQLTITGANRFKDVTNTVQPCTIVFPANVTTSVEYFSLNGTPGNVVSIRSSVAGQRFNLVKVV